MTEAEDATRSLMAFPASGMTTLYLSKDHSPKLCSTWHHLSRLQVMMASMLDVINTLGKQSVTSALWETIGKILTNKEKKKK